MRERWQPAQTTQEQTHSSLQRSQARSKVSTSRPCGIMNCAKVFEFTDRLNLFAIHSDHDLAPVDKHLAISMCHLRVTLWVENHQFGFACRDEQLHFVTGGQYDLHGKSQVLNSISRQRCIICIQQHKDRDRLGETASQLYCTIL